MKMVGVRPLSKHYFELYKEDVRERRINIHQVLFLHFMLICLLILKSIQASEIRYLDAFDKHPLLTDIKYFLKSWWE